MMKNCTARSFWRPSRALYDLVFPVLTRKTAILALFRIVEQSQGSGLRLEHGVTEAGIDDMDIFERCLFLFVTEDFL